jgi:putative heme transporter
VGIFVVTGKTDELSGASAYLDDLRWYWIVVAAVLEGASVVAYAALQRRLLAAGDVDLGMKSLTGITLAGYSIQNSLPGGIVFSTVFAFRQFNRRGADDVLSGWTLLATTVLSQMALVVLAGVGFAAATGTGNALNLGGVIAGMIVFTALIVAIWVKRDPLLRRLGRPLGLVQRVIRRPKGDPHELVNRLADRLTAVTPSALDWARASVWALGNWVLDAGCLIVAFVAVGAPIPWRALPLAYSAAQLAANLPITPGGLGVVEGSLTIALVAYGGGRASTVAAVLAYRVLSFWAILPAGWISWVLVDWTVRRAKPAGFIEPHLVEAGEAS